jgi:hypothetical protein
MSSIKKKGIAIGGTSLTLPRSNDIIRGVKGPQYDEELKYHPNL